MDLSGLDVEGLELEIGTAERHGITATTVTVKGAPGQPHRHWSSIRDQIDAAGPRRAAAPTRAGGVRAARASPRAGSTASTPEQVHFHEVGAVDAIGEVVGVALALESLDIDRVDLLAAARGPRVRRRRARAAAAAGARRRSRCCEGAPVYGVEIELELVTPTGAALVASLAESYGPIPRMTLTGSGYGAGTRDLEGAAERRPRDRSAATRTHRAPSR